MTKISHTHTVTKPLTLPLHWLVGHLECSDEANKYLISFETQRKMSVVIMMFTDETLDSGI